MKKRLQGLIAGMLIGAMLTGGVVFAKSGTEIIEALYNNIKIYVDGVKIEPKDVSGKTVEPFIYNGTTYLPVRAVGEAIGKTVTWDSTTQSVYLGKKPENVQYLMDVCPPYNAIRAYSYLQSKGESFFMGGKKYSNGFILEYPSYESEIYFNLDSKYSQMNLTLGHVDGGTTRQMRDADILFFLDGKLIKTVNLIGGELPKEITVPVNYGLQLKIIAEDASGEFNSACIGFGNIIVK